MDWRHPEVSRIIRAVLDEDIGPGDLTTSACIPESAAGSGVFLARQPLVVAGVELLPEIYEVAGGVERVEILLPSGSEAAADQIVAQVAGRLRTMLTAERVALNFLQRLSGVATLARQFVQAVAGTRCRILDTRKTTPGIRRLEKLAVRAGGAQNHRFGLYDAFLIKNNHITAAGGLSNAVARANASPRRDGLEIEVEVRGDEEIEQALACGVRHLLLDNFSPERAAAAIRKIGGRATVEVSGGITLCNVRAYAATGADFVSAGALTHSAPAVDLSFRIV